MAVSAAEAREGLLQRCRGREDNELVRVTVGTLRDALDAYASPVPLAEDVPGERRVTRVAALLAREQSRSWDTYSASVRRALAESMVPLARRILEEMSAP